MKLVSAIIKPFKIDDIRTAVAATGVRAMTVTQVKGFGRQNGRIELYRGAEYALDFLPKAKLELAVEDDQAEAVVHAIEAAARSGRIGDGKIFVTDLPQATRIRTGECGTDAI